eukprot:3061956-Rhodomonas_salina.2
MTPVHSTSRGGRTFHLTRRVLSPVCFRVRCAPCPVGTYSLESPRLLEGQVAGQAVATAEDKTAGLARCPSIAAYAPPTPARVLTYAMLLPGGALCARPEPCVRGQVWWRRAGSGGTITACSARRRRVMGVATAILGAVRSVGRRRLSSRCCWEGLSWTRLMRREGRRGERGCGPWCSGVRRGCVRPGTACGATRGRCAAGRMLSALCVCRCCTRTAHAVYTRCTRTIPAQHTCTAHELHTHCTVGGQRYPLNGLHASCTLYARSVAPAHHTSRLHAEP